MSNPPKPAPSVFPEELPPRSQPLRQRPNLRQCLTWKFIFAYSVRKLPDARTKWRRSFMILSLMLATASAILSVLSIGFAFDYVGNVVGVIVFSIVDFFAIWLWAWSIAIIGDVTGRRRCCGRPIGRRGFDIFIYCTFAFQIIWLLLLLMVVGGWIFQGLWIAHLLVAMGFAWVAAQPPLDASAADIT